MVSTLQPTENKKNELNETANWGSQDSFASDSSAHKNRNNNLQLTQNEYVSKILQRKAELQEKLSFFQTAQQNTTKYLAECIEKDLANDTAMKRIEERI